MDELQFNFGKANHSPPGILEGRSYLVAYMYAVVFDGGV